MKHDPVEQSRSNQTSGEFVGFLTTSGSNYTIFSRSETVSLTGKKCGNI